MDDKAVESLKYFVFASIISADNDEFTEDEKQAVIARYDKNSNPNWEYILEPLVDKGKKYIKLLKE